MTKSLIATVFVVCLCLVSAPAFAAGPAPGDVGQPAVDFTIKNFDTGKDFVLSAEIKKSEMVFIWLSSTCSTCLAEAIELKGAMEKGDVPKDVKIYIVNIDFNDTNIAAYKSGHLSADFTVLHDAKYVSPPKYGFRSTPSTLIINKKGLVAYKSTGYQSGGIAELVKAIAAAK